MSITTSGPATEADARIDALRTKIEGLKNELSAAQRQRPAEPIVDWELKDLDGKPVRLSQLFGEHKDMLVIHNMGRGCRYCSMWADGLNGFMRHLPTRCAFVLCSNDPPHVAKDFAAERGWKYRVVSGSGSQFARTMGFADEQGKPWPGVSALRKLDDGSIVRTGKAPFGPGDDFCAIWPLFDLFEGGVGKWEPK